MGWNYEVDHRLHELMEYIGNNSVTGEGEELCDQYEQKSFNDPQPWSITKDSKDFNYGTQER